MKIFLFLILTFTPSFSQGVKVDYTRILEGNNFERKLSNPCSLHIQDSKCCSIFFEDFSSPKTESSDVIVGKGIYAYYKNYSENLQIYHTIFMTERLVINDSLDIFHWKINNATKEILGYTCQEATCDFRGRSYVAYFTKDIPIADGPWKFNGLPGLILEVSSVDQFISYKADAVSFNDSTEVKRPYQKYSSITYTEFKEYYKKMYYKLKDHVQYKEDGVSYSTRTIGKGGIEIHVD